MPIGCVGAEKGPVYRFPRSPSLHLSISGYIRRIVEVDEAHSSDGVIEDECQKRQQQRNHYPSFLRRAEQGRARRLGRFHLQSRRCHTGLEHISDQPRSQVTKEVTKVIRSDVDCDMAIFPKKAK